MSNCNSSTPETSRALVYASVHAAVADAQKLRGLRWLFPSPSRRRRPLAQDSTRTSLATLPVELLIEILQYLPARDIAKVQTVCRGLCDAAGCTALQLIIEEFLAGVETSSATGSSLTCSRERLDRLRRWNRARRRLNWDRVLVDSALVGSFWVRHTRGQTFSYASGVHGALRMITLPSRTAGSSRQLTQVISWPRRHTLDHWIDPSQDLVVIHTCSLYNVDSLVFLCASSGEILRGVNMFPDTGITIDLQILNNFVVIDCTSETRRRHIIVMDWKSCLDPLTLCYSEYNPFPEKIAFLDEDRLVCFMVAWDTTPASVVIIPWQKLCGKKLPFSEVLKHSTAFHLPQLTQDYNYKIEKTYDAIKLHCRPSARQQNPVLAHAPFFDTRPPLIMLTFSVARKKSLSLGTQFVFLIPGRTLTSRLKTDSGSDHDPALCVRTWRDWGEDTRVWPSSKLSSAAVHGSRLFCLEESPDARSVVVYDFDSPEAMARDIRADDKSLENIVVKPSYLPTKDKAKFQERVVTKAPYRKLKSDVMLDRDFGWVHFGENCVFVQQSGLRFKAYSI